MAHSRSVGFANFVCRFGEKFVLLDLAEEVVIPAFLHGGQRMYGESRYIIQDTNIVSCGDNNRNLLIVGRFIKDTILSREQKLENGKLVKSKASMPSAPSAVFALVMDTHKLLYLPETSHAPTLSAFRATTSNLIKKQHQKYIDGIYEAGGGQREKETRKSILERLPYPGIEIIPLSSTQDFEHFLKQFKVLEKIKIDLIDTNNETDGMGLVRAARNVKNSINAKGVSISYKNNSGLSSNDALNAFTNLAEDGNTKLTLSGKDSAGDQLSGDNEKFKMSVPVETDSDSPKIIGVQLFDVFMQKIKAGLLKIQKPEQSATEKVNKLAIKFANNK